MSPEAKRDTGVAFEVQCISYLKSLGFVTRRWSEEARLCQMFDKEVLAQPRMTDPMSPSVGYHKREGRGDFLIRRRGKPTVFVECKYQEKTGSVDEKFPYILMCAKSVEQQQVLLVIEGHGMQAHRLQWLRERCLEVNSKSIVVVDYDGFVELAKIIAGEP